MHGSSLNPTSLTCGLTAVEATRDFDVAPNLIPTGIVLYVSGVLMTLAKLGTWYNVSYVAPSMSRVRCSGFLLGYSYFTAYVLDLC